MTQARALDILKTGANVFLTGEPGSGKTHTVNEYIRYLKRTKVKVAVTASTGIAATHIGGVTVHSWSGIGIKRKLSEYDLDRITSFEPTVKRVKRAAVLIIDEISMLEGAVLDSVNRLCREIRQSPEPFGGLQVVLVGDFFQLPPVGEEGKTKFAFESRAWREANFLTCYLSEQHRQEDKPFLEILAAMRRDEIAAEHHSLLAARQVKLGEGEITKLYTHNVDVDRINQQELARVPGDSKTFRMAVTGRKALVEQLQRGCLSPESLTLKEGAVVMFTKNSPKGLFVNGTLGTVTGFDSYNRLPVVETRDGREVRVEPMDWVVEDDGRVKARISQVPLRLAWAITVHKSQGMSLDASFVDLRSAFLAGQGYVALSRVRTLAGLFLAGYNERAMEVDKKVLTQDVVFREQSVEAERVFNGMSLKELAKMQRNFTLAVGGKIPRKSKLRVR